MEKPNEPFGPPSMFKKTHRVKWSQKYMKKAEVKFLEMKTTTSDIKNIQDGMDIAAEMISELEDIAIEIIQNQTQREQRLKKLFFFF